MRERDFGLLVLAFAAAIALLAVASATPLQASGDEEKVEKIKKIRVEKAIEDCATDDCEGARRVVIRKMGAEGKTIEQDHFEWTEESCEGDDCEGRRRIIVKKMAPGDAAHGVSVMSGDANVHMGMVRHHELLGHHGKGGLLGIQLTDLTPELRRHFGVGEAAGVMIAKVLDNSPAESAGLQVGDIVTAIDGEGVSSSWHLASAVGALEGGTDVELEIWSQGSSTVVPVTLGSRAGEDLAGHGMRYVVVTCDEDENCEAEIDDAIAEIDCGDEERCEVEIRCESEECSCTVNDAPVDCEELGLAGGIGG
jgi:hypothetical protein